MAQLYCSGAMLLWCGIGAAGAPVFIGTSEGAPEIEIDPEFEPVRNDLGGSAAFDYSFQGEEAIIRFELNRWNEAAFATLQARPTPSGTRGVTVWGDVGKFLIQEGGAYGTWVQFPYGPGGQAAKAGMATMLPGYHFLFCFLEGDRFRGGTKPNKRTVVFHAIRAFNPANGAFTLYDTSVAGLGAIN